MPLSNCSSTAPMAIFEASVVNANGFVGSGCDNWHAFVSNNLALLKLLSRFCLAKLSLNVKPGVFLVAMVYSGCKISAGFWP